MDKVRKQFLEEKAREIRISTINMIGRLGVGHIGGSMSVIEILTVLYYQEMHIDARNPQLPARDKLVLSKGHAGPALYAVLADLGYFPREWLYTLNKGGSNLPSHCDMHRTPGVDMTTGSLGQGISAAVGLALANRLDAHTNHVFLIIGDGESNEGQVWEAAMAAVHFKLDTLIAFTDYNKVQIDGYVKDIMDLGDLASKWKSFGWYTQRVDGHDVEALSEAVATARQEQERPSMIICDTIKGKGCSIAEGIVSNHNMVFSYEEAQESIEKLQQ